MGKLFDVISIGSATFDVFLRSSKFPIDRQMVGSKIEPEELAMSSGGGGVNTAIGFSRLGLRTACIAKFGDDLFGQFIAEKLAEERFDKRYLMQRKGDNTDYSTILVNPDGSRTILVYRGKTRIEEKGFPWEALENTNYVYIASLEGNVDLLAKVVNKASEMGVGIILNPGSREIRGKEKLLPLLPKLKVLILNREEAESFGLTGSLKELVSEMLIITGGRQGARFFSKEKKIFAESFTVPVIDETGAGDAFSTGFVGGLIKGYPVEKCLKLAMAEGASVVGKFGAQAGLLYEKEIACWMSRKLRIG